MPKKFIVKQGKVCDVCRLSDKFMLTEHTMQRDLEFDSIYSECYNSVSFLYSIDDDDWVITLKQKDVELEF